VKFADGISELEESIAREERSSLLELGHLPVGQPLAQRELATRYLVLAAQSDKLRTQRLRHMGGRGRICQQVADHPLIPG
jgi:hypothetical protein